MLYTCVFKNTCGHMCVGSIPVAGTTELKLCTERTAVEGRSPLWMLTAGALFPVGLFALFLQTCEVGLCCECFISSRFDFGLNLLNFQVASG